MFLIAAGLAAALVLVFGWRHWVLGLTFLLMGSFRLLPRWLYWSLGALLMGTAIVVLF